MSNDKCESPPLSETNGVVKTGDNGVNIPGLATITEAETTLTEADISYDLVLPFKFSKSVTTDAIVNIDTDLIDMDSFQYVTKPSLIKAIVYLLKNFHQSNKVPSSVVIPVKVSTACQCDKVSDDSSDKATDTEKTDLCCQHTTEHPSPNIPLSTQNNQVAQISDLLQNFQSCLLKSVDEKLSVVDDKLSDAISQLSNDKRIKSFSEVAAQAAKNVEDIAKNTITSVENVAKQSIDIVNSKTATIENEIVSVIDDSSSSMNSADSNQSSDIFISNDTVIKLFDNDNSDVMVLTPVNPRTTYLQSKVDSVKKSLRDKLRKVPFEFANDRSKTGKIALRFPTSHAYDEAEKAVDSAFLASVGFESKKGRKMLPKITIRGVPSYLIHHINTTNLNQDQVREAKKQELLSQLRDKNPCIDTLVNGGHTFQIVYINSHANSEDLIVGLKVSPLIRSTILSEQNGFVFIGSKRCMFNDRFDVGQCYHCQLLGHNSQNCPNKNDNSTCLYCMGNHRSSSCSLKNQADKHCCAKCQSSTESNDAANFQSHNSASPNCPVYVRECQRLANITDFFSKNVM